MESFILFCQYIIAMIGGGLQYDTKATVISLAGIIVVAVAMSFVIERLFFKKKKAQA